MPQIHVLDQDTINQIAAGEVVERPMAVVKELVENAIDAGANAVTVEIKDGGKTLIRVTDNGSGIAKEDVPLAFTPHATSKIREASDLLGVSSLGFRGEALSSIAAVSQLEMVSKTRESLLGNRYVIEGGEEKAWEEVGCPEGTTFLIRNLFYNTPARLKFLKTPTTEAGYISTMLERLALSHPGIAFRLINQNQPKLTTSGNGNLKDVIYHIYGREITSNLLELHVGDMFCQVDGFLGKPVISRGNRNLMHYFINGRFIRSQVIHRAIEEAYAPYLMQHRYPFTVLHLTIDPAYLDVNVHPQKMELRFTKEKEIFQSLFHTLSEGLKHREYIPEVALSALQETALQETATQETATRETATQETVSQETTPRETATREIATQKIASQETALVAEPAPAYPHAQTKELPASDPSAAPREAPERVVNPEPKENTVQQSLFQGGELSEQTWKDLRIVGQVFSTYWVLEYGDQMYLVDQHAAHEKVLYERLMRQLQDKEPMVQMVQPPVILTLSMAEQQTLQEHKAIFRELGFQIEPFGGREYAVSGIPAHLPTVNTRDLLLEALDLLSEHHGSKTPEILRDRIATMSCKAAVKGNHRLDARQAGELMQELMTLDNPYHCPHGRPTMIQMSKRELEKKFKRIV